RRVDAGQRQTLVVGDGAAFGDFSHDVVGLNPFDDERDLAVVNEQTVPRRCVVGKVLVGGGHPVVGAVALLHRDSHSAAARQKRMPGSKPAKPDLWSLKVDEYTDRATGDVRRHADPVISRLVVGVVAVT